MEGYVYLIGTPVFGWYKIGKSKTPEIRVNNLGILLPFKLSVIGIWKAKNHHQLEKSLHEIYSKHQINGEWFEFTKPEAYAVFSSLPIEARVYPVDNTKHSLDRFSNVEQDTKKTRKVIGVRVQKLRGDFTDDERELIKVTAIEHQKVRKQLTNINSYTSREGGFALACNNPYRDKKVKLHIFTSLI